MNTVDIPSPKQSVTVSSAIFWGPVLLAFFSLITLGWLDNARGPLYPQILEGLSLSHVQGGAFFAVASFMAVIANFLVPTLLKYFSSVSTLLIGLVCTMIFVVGLSFSTCFEILIGAAVFFGLALGIIMVTINIVIEEFVPKSKQRSFLSVMHSLYGLAAFLSPLLIGYILAWPIKWSNAFLPILFVSVPLFIFGVWQCLRVKKGQVPSAGVVSEVGLSADLMVTHKKEVLIFWSLFLACYVSSELYFSTRLTILYQEGLGQNLELSRKFLSFFFLGLFVGRVINSVLPVKVSGKSIIMLSLLTSLIWLIFCIVFEPTWIWFMGFLMAPVYPVTVSEIAKQAGHEFKKISAMASAVSSFVVVIMHMLAGVIADEWGLKNSMYIPVCFLILGLGLVVTNWPRLDFSK